MVFTSGGTEADNLALKGLWWARLADDPRRRRILLSGIEHHAVLDPGGLAGAARGRRDRVAAGRTSSGRVRLDDVRRAIEQDPESVSFVTLMMANNEVGTLQPVREMAALAHEHDIPVHTDAVQAVGQVPVDFADLGVDAMTITAHKVGGPFGIGALVVAQGDRSWCRSCTAAARSATYGRARSTPPRPRVSRSPLEHAIKHQADEARRLVGLRDALIERCR